MGHTAVVTQNFVNMPNFVSGLDSFQFQIALLSFSPPACEIAVQRRFCMLTNATHSCKIMKIDSPHLEMHSEQLHNTIWVKSQPIYLSFLFTTPHLLSTSSSFLLSLHVQPLCVHPILHVVKIKWVNRDRVLFCSFHHNDDSLFSNFYHILCCRASIPPGCREHCTPPRGQTHSPAVEVIKTNPKHLHCSGTYYIHYYSLPKTEKCFCTIRQVI